MKSLIKCKNIKKSFGEQKVIQDFSYSFKNNNIYLLFGDSGCGKTTLLNILSGAISFDEGNLFIFNEQYHANENKKEIRDDIAYITQNTYFVDYLNIQDNLELCLTSLEDKPLINEYLEKFKLSDKAKSYPNELSGGERQRMSIIQALLKKQKILLLDEPTSSLDEKNKDIFYNILTELKKDHLIICATHDESMKTYADEIITFDDLSQYKSDESEMEESITSEIKKPSLLKYMLKQLTYKKREKASGVFLIIVLIIVFLIINACSDFQKKATQSLIETHGVNFVDVKCSVNAENYCEEYFEKYNAVHYYGEYEFLMPLGINENEPTSRPMRYPHFKSLPFDLELFTPGEEMMMFGTYFKDEKDIILGYDAAIELDENPEKLIGTKIKLDMLQGKDEFNIVGIFKTGAHKEYMNVLTGSSDYENYRFINSKYIEKYLHDDVLGMSEYDGDKSTYLKVFFENKNDQTDFYYDYVEPTMFEAKDGWYEETEGQNTDENIVITSYTNDFIEYFFNIIDFRNATTPIIFLAFITVFIFYFQTKNIQNHYTSHIFPVYYYYGYNWNKILVCSFVTELISVISKFILAFILSLGLSSIGNYINEVLGILSFKVFMLDTKMTLLFFAGMLIISSILTLVSLLMKKRKGWLEVIKEGDDLL